MYHKDLEVYKKSIDFVEHIYKLTALFPKEETYGLSSQLRRATVSIPSNFIKDLTEFNIIYNNLKSLLIGFKKYLTKQ